jgi:hypothetical protein
MSLGLSLSLLLSSTAVFCARSARADADEPPAARSDPGKPYGASIRAAAGLGGGQMGVSERAVIAGERWLGDRLGAGVFFDAAAQASACWFCASENEATQFAAATLAARTAPRGSYGLLTLGAGYAWGRRWLRGAPSLLGRNEGTESGETYYAGAVLNLSAGWLFHPGALEIGPLFVVDATTWGSVTFTANLSVGVVL